MLDLLKLIADYLDSLPIVRVIYSLVLLTVALALARELVSVWRRKRIFLTDMRSLTKEQDTNDHGARIRSNIARALTIAGNYFNDLPFLRLVYSLLLFTPMLAVGREAIRVWERQKIFLADFSYFVDGQESKDRATQFRDDVVQNYDVLLTLMKSDHFIIFGAGRADFLPTTIDEFVNDLRTKKADNLSSLDINIHGINIQSLISTFANLVTPLNKEIKISAFVSSGRRRVFVASELSDGLPRVMTLEMPDEDADSAFRVACSLIWSQWNRLGPASSSDPHGSVEEFCDWIRIIKIKQLLQTADPYRLEDRKKDLTLIDFVANEFALAAERQIKIRQLYASLTGLEGFFGAEKITLGGQIQTDIDAISDLIPYLAITDAFAEPAQKEDWIRSLTSPALGRRTINTAFFKSRISSACYAEQQESKAVIRDASANVVRIVAKFDDDKGIERKYISTGLIVEDRHVLATMAPLTPVTISTPEALQQLFSNASISVTRCDGQAPSPLKVSSASFIDRKTRSPFVNLEVPGLKLQGKKPLFSGFMDRPTASTLIGYMDEASLFDKRPHSGFDYAPSEKYFLSTTVTIPFNEFKDYDNEQRDFLSSPFGVGLIGSPIYNFELKDPIVEGFVQGSVIIGTNLSLAVGISSASLRRFNVVPFGSQ
jgi:hypothetical protein